MFALKFAGQEESESYSSPSSSSEKKEEDPAVQKEGGPAEKKEAPLEKKDENLWVQVAKKGITPKAKARATAKDATARGSRPEEAKQKPKKS